MKKITMRAKCKFPLKKLICLALIFILGFNSFAVIVSDNDGSAFITKAEFDSLKNNFQSQIDSYNQSIDSKIDGSIASYLSGISIAQIGEVSSLIYRCSAAKNITWKSNWVFPTTRIGNQYKRGSFHTWVYGCRWVNDAENPGVMFQVNLFDTGHGNLIGSTTVGSNPSIYVSNHEYNAQSGVYYAQTTDFRTSIPFAYLYASTSSSWSRVSYRTTDTPILTWSKTEYKKDATDKYAGSRVDNINITTGGGQWTGYARGMGENYSVGFTDSMGYATTNVNNLNYIASNNINTDVYSIIQDEETIVDYDNPKAIIYSHDDDTHTGTWDGYIMMNLVRDNASKDGASYKYNHSWLGGAKLDKQFMSSQISYYVYEHKHKKINAKDYVQFEFSNASGENVYYYSGIPVLKNTAGKKGVVKFTIKIKNNNSNQSTYQFRKVPFTNSDTLDASDIDIYSDPNLTSKVTTFTNNSTSWQTKTYYCTLDKEETLWVKAMPYNTSQTVDMSSDDAMYEISFEN